MPSSQTMECIASICNFSAFLLLASVILSNSISLLTCVSPPLFPSLTPPTTTKINNVMVLLPTSVQIVQREIINWLYVVPFSKRSKLVVGYATTMQINNPCAILLKQHSKHTCYCIGW